MDISHRTINSNKRSTTAKSTLTNQNNEVSKELLTTLYNRNELFLKNCTAYETCLWIESNENLMFQKGRKNTTKYKQKDIVLADLGIDTFGHEFSYEHPCIIIYNHYDKVFIVPCTSQPARRDRYGNLYSEQLEGTVSDGFAKTTTILLKEAKFIDKTRIKSVVGSVGTTLFNSVYNTLFKFIFESKDYQINKLIEKDVLNRKEVESIKKEKESLEQELHTLKYRYNTLFTLAKKNITNFDEETFIEPENRNAK